VAHLAAQAGGPRRALAIFALVVTAAGLVSVVFAPAGASTGRQETAGPVLPLGAPPRLCSACGPAASAWVSATHSPLVVGPDGAPRVDPRRIAVAATAPPPDRRFGVVEAFVAPFAAAYAGVGWERLNFAWPSLQPMGPDAWNQMAVSGALINGEMAAGREIVGLIGGRPRWARDARGLPRGLYLPPDDPRNLWGAFVAGLVRRYRGRVRHWIIWNEPDVWDPHSRGYTWPGSVDDFARLLKVAYVQIKRVDPTLMVHLAATTYWWDYTSGRPLYFARLLDALGRDPAVRAHHWYFDVASAHVYNVPDDVEKILLIDRSLMRAHGFDKPIWLNETNAMPTDDGPWAIKDAPGAPRHLGEATAGEQAAYVAQTFSLALAAGAERVSLYKMADPAHLSPRAYPVGLVRPDGTARPVIAALRATTQALSGWVSARDLGMIGSVRAVAVDRGARGGTLVLWNVAASPATATVGVPVPPGTTQAWVAAHAAVIADDDTYQPVPATLVGNQAILRITLAPSACTRDGRCHIGGAPIMVVAPAMPQVRAL
jgi:hypothetical protein